MILIRNQFRNKNPNYIHGYRGTKLYKIWRNMKSRCLNKNRENYQYYGGRGITIYPEWLDFIPFRDWALKNEYREDLTIDRKDINGNYEPSNCQWIPLKENCQKKRTTKLNMQIANEIRKLYKTEKYTQKELAERFNVGQAQISKIIKNDRWVL